MDSVGVVLLIFSDSDSSLSSLLPSPVFYVNNFENMSIFGIVCISSSAAAFFLLLQAPLVDVVVLLMLVLKNLGYLLVTIKEAVRTE